METIRSYVNNQFAHLPQSDEILQAKNEILASMESQYQALLDKGHSQSDAAWRVISETGSMDDLLRKRNIPVDEDHKKHAVSLEEARRFLDAKRRSARMVAAGVMLCILAVASLLLIQYLSDQGLILTGLASDAASALGLVPLFFFVAVAVALFILSGVSLQPFGHLDQGFVLPNSVRSELEKSKAKFTTSHAVFTVIGVSLCILSPLAVVLPSVLISQSAASLGVVFFLVIISIAVFSFVYFGGIKASHERLLDEKNQGIAKGRATQDSQPQSVIASILWPMAVIIFLLLGFLGQLWYIAWIIFPITALLQGMISAVLSAMKKDK